MNYKFIIIFVLLFSCSPLENEIDINFKQSYKNYGFALIFNEEDYNTKIINKYLDERSLIIFQKNLSPGTKVKITNIINNKAVVATVGKKAIYPSFYNSVISKRIANELDIDLKEPYIKIQELNKNQSFIANKAKTFDEEREVAAKAPVDEIGIKDLSKKIKETKIIIRTDFNYLIKIADFYYYKSAKSLKLRIKNELNIKNVKINDLSKTQFRVYLGPYKDLESLKKIFKKIEALEFENIEIIKL
tara:strand:- start:915 stop:1652 length:738 start_codon:yes stop_codon:yes gene_type:complete